MPEMIKWEDPPPSRNNMRVNARQKIDQIVKELKSNPGHWALVDENRKSTGNVTTWKNRGCDTTQRRTSEGLWNVYARWPIENGDQ